MSEQITILGVTIRTNKNGLYSITDLWKASGSMELKSPFLWFCRYKDDKYSSIFTKKPEQEHQQISIELSDDNKNKNIFVCKELACIYAMWVSSKFYYVVKETLDSFEGNDDFRCTDYDDVKQ